MHMFVVFSLLQAVATKYKMHMFAVQGYYVENNFSCSFVLNYRYLQSLYYTLNLSIFHIKIELINFDSKIVEKAYALLVIVLLRL
jgi:hypothetical protein